MLKKLSLLIVFMIGMQSGISAAESLESLQEILNLNHDLKNVSTQPKALLTPCLKRDISAALSR